MRARSRRRLDSILGLVAALAVAALAAIGAAVGGSERITSMWVSATMTSDTSGLAVTEVIDYDFGLVSRHGIYRDIPDIDTSRPVSAASPTAPDEIQLTELGSQTRVRIGDPNTTIDRLHRYTIAYDVDHGAVATTSRFFWDAVGNDWTVPIQHAEIHLALSRQIVSSRCDTGDDFAEGGCAATVVEPGLLTVSVDDLDAGEGVTITVDLGAELDTVALVPPAPTGPADDPGTGLVPPAVAAALGALAASVPAAVLVRRLGREQVWSGGAVDAAHGPTDTSHVTHMDESALAELATIEFESPRGMSAVEGGILIEEKVGNHHLTAWMLESAIREEIELDSSGDDPILRRGPVAAAPTVGPVLEAMFGSRQSITLDTYDEQFSKGWTRLRRELNAWRKDSDHWDPEATRRRGRVIGLGALLALAGLAAAFFGGWRADRVGATLAIAAVGGALAGAGVTFMVRSWELHVRTPAGSARWLQVESFRRFLHESEAQHVEYAAEKGLLRQYTAWAVALDETDAWTDAIASSSVADTDHTGVHGRDLAFVAAASSLSSAASSASTAPSSSGSSGGGFSGGGGGGGGGGSW